MYLRFVNPSDNCVYPCTELQEHPFIAFCTAEPSTDDLQFPV